uniref:Uncharacterized protein n=1 Tax=Nannospalax galili TaxID=1026970 RepID=A0A8C6S2I7_NANGA
MRDRLEELRNQVSQGRSSSDLDDALVFDNLAFKETKSNPIEKFLQEVAALFLALTELEGLSQLIGKKQKDILCCTTEETSFVSQAWLIQSQLSSIQHKLATDCKYWQVEYHQLSVLLSHHYACETQYLVRLKEKVMSQAELAGMKLQEEDLEKLLANPVAPQIVGHDLDVLKGKKSLALARVRQQQLLDLEYQISELQTIFLQVEILISGQQELLDMKKALKYKCQSCFLMVVSTVAGICTCCTYLSCIPGTV